mmetsp:Transcript_21074/g.48164  ORF Transcript_21074/g.48164 Transcript_21074/m.48164 type:complete len:238 (-) Transcript_21074:1175-1888(-)
MPGLEGLLPFLPLALEPLRGLQVLDPCRLLALFHPLFEVVLALVGLGPVVADLVKALVLVGDAELHEGGVEGVLLKVWNGWLAEKLLLLLGSQLHLGRLLVVFGHLLVLLLLLLGVLLLRLGLLLLLLLFCATLCLLLFLCLLFRFLLGLLLSCFLSLFPFPLEFLLLELLHFLALLLGLFDLELGVCNLLFCFQRDLLQSLLHDRRWLAHHDRRAALEAGCRPSRQILLPLFLDQV